MASVTADEVIVALEARMGDYDRRIAQSERHFTRSMASMQGSASRTERIVSFAARSMGAALAGISAVAIARSLLKIADAAKNIDAQLKLATAQSGNFAQAQEDVRRVAAETRSDLDATAQLYGNFQRNARELGITQAEAARATETVSKTFKISGASAVEAAQGVRQLVQGLQSGTLRGDEFNTIMESSPRLARLLADSLGVPIGSLRAMAEEGDLTSAALVRAFTDKRYTDGIDAEFRQLPVTFDQAMGQLYNAAVLTFGAFDRGGEFSTALANFVLGGTDGMADLERSAEDLGISVRGTIEGLADVWEPFGDAGAAIFDWLGLKSESLGDQIRNNVYDALKSLDQIANRTQAVRPGEFSIAGMLGFPSYTSDMAGEFRRSAEESDRQRRGELALDRIFAQPWPGERDGPPRAVTPPKPKKRGPRGPSAETLARRAEAERLRAARDEAAFQQDLARFNEDLLAARQALVTAADAVAAYEIQMVETERQRVNAGIQAEVTQKRLTQAQADQLIALNDQVAAERRRAIQLGEEERIRHERVEVASAALDDEMDLASAQQQLAETAAERRAVGLRLLDLQYQQERLELEALIASRDATDAQKAIARARLDILAQMQAADAEGIRRSTAGPMESFLDSIPDTAAEMDEALEQLRAGGIQSAIDGLAELSTEYLKLGGIAGQVINGIIEGLVRLALQQAVLRIFGGGEAAAAGSGLSALAGGIATPGAALGGSFLIGGRGGTDKNLLSLNGKPVLRVSRGEQMHIVPQGRSFGPLAARVRSAAPVIRNFNIHVSADNSVTPAGFAKGLASEILREAKLMDAQASAATLKAVPGRLSRFQTDGT